MSTELRTIDDLLRESLHLSDDEVEQFAAGRANDGREAYLRNHLRICRSCRREVQIARIVRDFMDRAGHD